MTIKFTDACPNCGKNIENFVKELDEKFYEPFACPCCKATLELKKSKYRIFALIAVLWVLSLLVSVWCMFGSLGCPSELKELSESLSSLLFLVLFGVLWLQDLRVIKLPPQNDKTT